MRVIKSIQSGIKPKSNVFFIQISTVDLQLEVSIIANFPIHKNVFVTPKSVLAAFPQSLVDMCRAGKNWSHLQCIFTAEVEPCFLF